MRAQSQQIQALAGTLSVFAQFERQLIVERVRSGMNHAKKYCTPSGKAIGRPVKLSWPPSCDGASR
jgi:DNA invertase Pin-like site-specific DNA recombinase